MCSLARTSTGSDGGLEGGRRELAGLSHVIHPKYQRKISIIQRKVETAEFKSAIAKASFSLPSPIQRLFQDLFQQFWDKKTGRYEKL